MTAPVGCVAAFVVAAAAPELVAEVAFVEPEVPVEADAVAPLAVVVLLVVAAVDMVEALLEAVPVDVTERSEAMMEAAWDSIET